jgi:hypothetical protein
MIWFAIIWLAVGSVAAILFGLMTHQSRVPFARPDTDRAPHEDHIATH